MGCLMKDGSDRELHHHDGGHRWTGGHPDDETWKMKIDFHMDDHRSSMYEELARTGLRIGNARI